MSHRETPPAPARLPRWGQSSSNPSAFDWERRTQYLREANRQSIESLQHHSAISEHFRAQFQALRHLERRGPGLQLHNPPGMERRKSWPEKYMELRSKNKLVLKEVLGRPNEGCFIHTNEIAFDINYNRGAAIFWTGVHRGDAGMVDGFADDVILVITKSRAIFIRLNGSCSVEEIERAFVQICYYTDRDLLWYVLHPPKCFVHWFRPMDYKTGAFLYQARVEQRVRAIERLLKKQLNSSGGCEISVHNVFPRKEMWQPATLSIEVLNYKNQRRMVVQLHRLPKGPSAIKSMATLIYAALVAYHKSKSKAADESLLSGTTGIKRTTPIPPHTPNFETPSSIDDDEEEHRILFPHPDAPNTTSQSCAISNDTACQEHSTQHSDSISSAIRTTKNDESVNLYGAAVVYIEKRENASSNNEVQSYTSHLAMGKKLKFVSINPIKICASSLHGQDDLVICYFGGCLLAIRIPVPSVPLGVLQTWTENILNALETSSLRRPCPNYDAKLVCIKHVLSHETRIYHLEILLELWKRKKAIRWYKDSLSLCDRWWMAISHTKA
ncbi:hypothetical protein UA08_08093 [Talaromyces atroroseus]|uniref:Uncharacterized protein n=1 Tax=Talaromyces atroroseus TaxID=1441469 RepID=A0A225AN39_TALAT|nr:hypothetical protein UA08_08093 [Talaromyces atroroseus]OKL56366.1 hypothetical protein UA08_08093 [Talaromyces atroroseus]